MIITGSIDKVRKISGKEAKLGKIIGFVPTMGALHEGHLSLVKRARKECDFLIASVFINPTQFGVGEDYWHYPRSLPGDKKQLKAEGVNLLFFPKISTMYPPGGGISVCAYENDLSRVLCGQSRPDHFKGVCTILVKLFNIVKPDIAYFGQKDYQQALIVKKLVRDFNFPIRIRVLPSIREIDNLAMSSRNTNLKGQARKSSCCLYQALALAKKLIKSGEIDPKRVISQMKQLVKSRELARIDYIEIVDADNLKKLKRIKGKVLIALAVYIKKVRLIDNIILNVKK
ncbi:MAG: pantoate--beta-alanine ligase [Candidatus Omnitrophica bacterium]|nr:pantoate--beta-alanine ligase [Candidatus Omnitrophota bacterium]